MVRRLRRADFDHPLFVSLCNFFGAAGYIDGEAPVPHELAAKPADDDPNAFGAHVLARAQQYRAERLALAAYARRYAGEG